jgi:hypothetical protein
MKRRDETPREEKPAPPRQRLVLISGDAEDDAERPEHGSLRIVGSEPRVRGGFRLTDR